MASAVNYYIETIFLKRKYFKNEKVLLWRAGDRPELYWKLGIEKILKSQNIQLLAIIDSNTPDGFKKYGYDVIHKNDIMQYNYDEILITTDYGNYLNIYKDVQQLKCA